MKRILFVLSLILVSIHQPSGAEEDPEWPKWMDGLNSNAVQTFQTEVSISRVKLPDNLEKGKYFAYCLKGNGSLKTISDPFETMQAMFSKDGWQPVPVYDADGHGSSSFAYKSGKRLCNIHVAMDSSCDDEETGHVPSVFWFEIYCREE